MSESKEIREQEAAEDRGRPFSSPGLMYAIFAFGTATLFLLLDTFLNKDNFLLRPFLLLPALVLVVETVFLMFLQPTVFLSEDTVHVEGRYPSIWKSPVRLFRWVGEERDRSFPLSSCSELSLNYTRVPFPLPLYPLGEGLFTITRWMLMIRHQDKECYLLDLTASPEAITEMAERARDFTELPLNTPWSGEHKRTDDAWKIVPESEEDQWVSPGDLDVEVNRYADRSDKGVWSIAAGPGLSLGRKIFGLCVSVLLILLGITMIFVGLTRGTEPVQLLASVAMMVGGMIFLFGGTLAMAKSLAQKARKIVINQETIYVKFPFGRSTEIPLSRIRCINGVYQNNTCSEQFGVGKQVPVLEVFSDEDWFVVPVEDNRVLDLLYDLFDEMFRNPGANPP